MTSRRGILPDLPMEDAKSFITILLLFVVTLTEFSSLCLSLRPSTSSSSLVDKLSRRTVARPEALSRVPSLSPRHQRHRLHQENLIFTFRTFFHFLHVPFFHLLAKLGFRQKSSTLEKLKILIFHLLVSRVASYPMPVVGLLLEILYICICFEIYAYFSRYVYFSSSR